METILVTGGTGMVGKHLQDIMPEAMYIGREFDLTKWLTVNTLIERLEPTHVIHLAAKVGGIQDNIENPADYISDNILMDTNILRACSMHNVKNVTAILSTCAYPDKMLSYPLKEKDLHSGPPAESNFSYGYAKRSLAVQIDAYNKQYNTNWNYLIPCNLYSEYDNYNNIKKMHFITALIRKIKESPDGNIELLGTGKPRRQFIYAGDLARIIKRVIDDNITESFNVACDENYSIDELTRLVFGSLNKNSYIKYIKPELDGQYRKDVSNEKLKEIMPDFKFTDFNKGIKKVYEKSTYNRN